MSKYNVYDHIQLAFVELKDAPRYNSFEEIVGQLNVHLDDVVANRNDPFAFRTALVNLAAVALKSIADRKLRQSAPEITQAWVDAQIKSIRNNGVRPTVSAVEGYGFVRLATLCIERKIEVRSTNKIGDDLASLVLTIILVGDDLKLAEAKEAKKSKEAKADV